MRALVLWCALASGCVAIDDFGGFQFEPVDDAGRGDGGTILGDAGREDDGGMRDGGVGLDAGPDAGRSDAGMPDAGRDSGLPRELLCGDGTDDDGDGFVDCLDPDCAACPAELDCTNGVDDDRDGLLDCRDPDCPSNCEVCDSGVDDDLDGLGDCDDPECAACVYGGHATSLQIDAIRTSSDGPIDIAVERTLVTYLRPAIGTDAAGFFVQNERLGPALFVRVDPASLTPPAHVGQVVSFRALDVTGTPRQTTMIADWVENDPLGPAFLWFLPQEVSMTGDLVTNLPEYENELVRARFRVTGPFTTAGAGFVGAPVETDALAGLAPTMRFRMPATLQAMFDISPGCTIELGTATPLWRFAGEAQPSAWDASEFALTGCPQPRVVSALAISPTQVRVDFDRLIDPATVNASGTQFRIVSAPALSVSGATVTGPERVTLTTGPQLPAAAYTIQVDATVRDTTGAGIDGTGNQVTFTGFTPPDHFVINEIDYDNTGTDTNEFIELYNGTTATIDLSRYVVVLVNGSGMVEYNRIPMAGMLPPNGYALIASATVVPTVAPALLFTFSGASNNIQNGMPDGIAILDTATMTIVDALAYEDPVATMTMCTIGGVPGFNLVEGSAATASDIDTGGGGSLVRLPNGTDTNNAAMDWAFTNMPSPGGSN